MLTHVVTYRWRDGVGEDEIQRLVDALGELPAQVPSIRSYRFGRDAALADGTGDFAIVAEFDDEAGWRDYLDHPDHLVVVGMIKGMIDSRTAVQLRAS